MPYTINGISFKSQQDVKNYCRSIRDRVTGQDLYDVEFGVTYCLTGDDKAFMLDLIRNLASAEEIIGCGIAEVLICAVPKGKPHWGFCVLRHDASESIFGFGKFGATPAQARQRRLTEAFRNAISWQTILYKEQFFDGHAEAYCEATGELMTRFDCHVDHEEPTFKELVEEFLQNYPGEIGMVDDGLCWHIADERIRSDWENFHQQRAKLRCTTSRFNLTRKVSA